MRLAAGGGNNNMALQNYDTYNPIFHHFSTLNVNRRDVVCYMRNAISFQWHT